VPAPRPSPLPPAHPDDVCIQLIWARAPASQCLHTVHCRLHRPAACRARQHVRLPAALPNQACRACEQPPPGRHCLASKRHGAVRPSGTPPRQPAAPLPWLPPRRAAPSAPAAAPSTAVAPSTAWFTQHYKPSAYEAFRGVLQAHQLGRARALPLRPGSLEQRLDIGLMRHCCSGNQLIAGPPPPECHSCWRARSSRCYAAMLLCCNRAGTPKTVLCIRWQS